MDAIAQIKKLRVESEAFRVAKEQVAALEIQAKHQIQLLLHQLPSCKNVERQWDLSLGESSCEKATIGFCVYDDFNDPAHKHCLFCGG